MTWQPNSDGTKMIGRMILTKNMAAVAAAAGGGGGGGAGNPMAPGVNNPSSASILGLKVVGGKRVDQHGRLAAVVEKVKRGSVADTIGHLRPGNHSSTHTFRPPLTCSLRFQKIINYSRVTLIICNFSNKGDEVLEWNGYPLQGRTFEEVYDIISESRADHQVEIVVSRPISDVGRPGANINPSGGPGQQQQQQQRGGGNVVAGGGNNNRMMAGGGGGLGGGPGGSTHLGVAGGSSHHQLLQRDRPAVTVTSPGDRHHQQTSSASSTWGKVQVKLWYDSSAQQLSATIVCGYDLPPRPNGAPRNPYAKLFLLPDKRLKTKVKSNC